MAIMDWNLSLDIGVDEMNGEHQRLLRAMNHLHDLYIQQAPFRLQKDALDMLKNATVEHFRSEEEYMRNIGWESADTHRYIHQSLLESFGKHYNEAVSKEVLHDEFFEFLRFWLAAHIQGIDAKYGMFVKSGKKSA